MVGRRFDVLEPPRTSHPTHIASSVMVRRFDEVGSICLNHPELVHKPPTHLASFVLVWFL